MKIHKMISKKTQIDKNKYKKKTKNKIIKNNSRNYISKKDSIYYKNILKILY